MCLTNEAETGDKEGMRCDKIGLADWEWNIKGIN